MKPIPRFSFNSIVDKGLKLNFWKAVFERDSSSLLKVFEAIVRSKAKEISVYSLSEDGKEIKALILQKRTEKTLFKLLQLCNENLEIPIRISAAKTAKNSYVFELVSDAEIASKSNKTLAQKIAQISEQKFRKKEGNYTTKKDRKNEFKDGLIFNFSKAISEEKTKGKTSEFISEIEAKIEVKKEEIKEDFVAEEGILLSNAGLVLLHPFIKHFFINMGLVDGKNVKPEQQDLAVHLLHYIATKNVEPSEHDLVFEKYLCNIPSLQPVDRYIKLSKAQKRSCDELLEAVLKHWSGLRTNAIDALRSEFLSREGKLSLKEDAHKLFVPRRTQDILLDTLPWNLHLVKLPWKKQMLYVEW